MATERLDLLMCSLVSPAGGQQRRTINERNARLAASYPNPDVNDLLASVNELSQLLFEHPMHTLVQMLLANARAMSDDDSEFPPYWTRPDEGRN